MKHLAAALLALAFAAAPAAADPRYVLAGQRTCLAGGGGPKNPARDWRVQLGVFKGSISDHELERRFAAMGVAVDAYIAVWLAGDDEPLVAVSRPYRTRAAAERAARRYRTKFPDAIVRKYAYWD